MEVSSAPAAQAERPRRPAPWTVTVKDVRVTYQRGRSNCGAAAVQNALQARPAHSLALALAELLLLSETATCRLRRC
jgi:hypothetical protein